MFSAKDPTVIHTGKCISNVGLGWVNSMAVCTIPRFSIHTVGRVYSRCAIRTGTDPYSGFPLFVQN